MDNRAIDYGRVYEEFVGEIMSKWRKHRGFPQDAVGASLGISGRTVGKYEKADIPIRAFTMAAVSKICDFDMIEYIPDENPSIARKFQGLIDASGTNPSYGHAATIRRLRQAALHDIQFVNYTSNGRTLFSATTDEDIDDGRVSKSKPDILTDLPKTQPLPLCDDDKESFEYYMAEQKNMDKRRILLYGYRLVMMFQEMDTPRQTTASMSKQILRRIIKNPGGDIDQDIYDFYWKCLYDRQG